MTAEIGNNSYRKGRHKLHTYSYSSNFMILERRFMGMMATTTKVAAGVFNQIMVNRFIKSTNAPTHQPNSEGYGEQKYGNVPRKR
ncbi:hypothetical protein [Williamwhitmania taraxaci]|uniref:hypothetical protein n=1 Tax=Williamwhitmania taraxaci TaxID=1640674 RepID=UPI000F78A508|nr:hypothetical protein [Williamwhitmania taraxaci]